MPALTSYITVAVQLECCVALGLELRRLVALLYIVVHAIILLSSAAR